MYYHHEVQMEKKGNLSFKQLLIKHIHELFLYKVSESLLWFKYRSQAQKARIHILNEAASNC